MGERRNSHGKLHTVPCQHLQGMVGLGEDARNAFWVLAVHSKCGARRNNVELQELLREICSGAMRRRNRAVRGLTQ